MRPRKATKCKEEGDRLMEEDSTGDFLRYGSCTQRGGYPGQRWSSMIGLLRTRQSMYRHICLDISVTTLVEIQ